jgi:hypothetical protein
VSTGELGLILATVGVAVGGGGWKIGAGLVELSRIVDKLGIEVQQMHNRMEKVESVIERIAPPTIKYPGDSGMPFTGN